MHGYLRPNGFLAASLALLLAACSAQNRPAPPRALPNQPPAVEAFDRAVNEGAAITLDAIASDPEDGADLAWAWEQTDGPTVSLTGAATAQPSFTAPQVPADTLLGFRVTVTDRDGATASDTLAVTVVNVVPPNQPPVADAGADGATREGELVSLDGRASADPDGSIVRYEWTQLSGTTVTIANANAALATFTVPTILEDETLVFQLRVTDAAGATAEDVVQVEVRDDRTAGIAGGSVVEGDSGTKTLVFTVALSNPHAKEVRVAYRTINGTATASSPARGDDDYVATSGTLVFEPQQLTATVPVTILGDTRDEDAEDFTLELSAPVGTRIDGAAATGTILDDDAFVFQVGTGQANHDPVARTCFGSGSMCSHSADPSADGEDAFRPNELGGRDHLISKATAITGANGQTFIVATTTNIGYFLAYKPEHSGYNGIYDVRLRIARATGVPSTHVTVVSDHSHNGPDTIGIWGGVSAEYMKITADAVVKAATDAFNSRRPATIRVAAINQNGAREPGVTGLETSYSTSPGYDLGIGNPYNEFRLLTADDASTGARILTFVNYAPHATVSNGDKIGDRYKLTGDWTAWAPQEAERTWGGMGLATVGALGNTDWNKPSGSTVQKEAEARARLRTLMNRATARLQPVQGDEVKVESVFVREPVMEPALLPLSYKPGLDHNVPGTPTDGMDVRIDRSVLPPFMTGSVVGTYVAAARIGDVFFSMFPGEPFGELNKALKDDGRVQGAQVQFLLGGANDFFGYMVKNLDTYQLALRTGFHYLPGCEDQTDELETQLGIRPEGEGACADHWTLMVSPTFGSHIVCTLQDAADRLGFTTANRDPECPAFTALDGKAPPPESGDPLADNPALARAAAVTAARTLANECAGSGAPAELCSALDVGAKQAAIYAGSASAVTPPADGQARAGVAVRDASWHLGASAGQFAAGGAGIARGAGYDPYGHSTRKVGSDILGTRVTTRALVIEGRDGKRVAIASNDLYLPNDLLHRRTAQLLAEYDLKALAQGLAPTGIGDDNLATSSSHSHTSPFYSTPGWGTWIFQDVMDLRFYEYMARQMADAVIEAANHLKPVRMGGATVKANDIQGHTYGPGVAFDGTPNGQPRDYTTQSVTVVHFDEILGTDTYKPLANWVIFGVHPEWVWGEEIVNGDITHGVMRMLDRESGGVTLWTQRETGSSGPHKDDRVHYPADRHEFQESNFSGVDRAARMLVDSIKKVRRQLDGRMSPERPDQFSPWKTGFEVDFASVRVAPPATRPYPGVSNCNTDRALEKGEVGTVIVPGLPDCSYDHYSEEVPDEVPGAGGQSLNSLMATDFPAPFPEDSDSPAEIKQKILAQFNVVLGQLQAAGVPVPSSYSGTSFTAVQETAAVHLQAFKLGGVGVTFCPCEEFTSLALNIESRLDKVTGNFWNGFDYACTAQARGLLPADPADSEEARHCALQNARYPEDGADGTVPLVIPGLPDSLADPDLPRARAQIHNDAAGWELHQPGDGDDGSVGTLGGEAEPTDPTKIKGNFTHEEFTAAGYGPVAAGTPADGNNGKGYDLVVAAGMSNDYWGYMVEYREYRAHSNAYRKALEALGPHGADFLATRLSRLAASLQGSDVALPFNPLDQPYQAEGQRADAVARTLGGLAQAYTAVYEKALPPDGGVPGAVRQPKATVPRFTPAMFQFVGGSNYEGSPIVTVERLVNGRWQTYGTQDGEVQLQLTFIPSLVAQTIELPIDENVGFSIPDPQAMADWASGNFQWIWTANFETFISEVPDLGSRPNITPAGKYRFVARGRHRATPGVSEYRVVSDSFDVVPWDGITVTDLKLEPETDRLSFVVGPVTTHTRFMDRAGDGVRSDRRFTVGPVDYPDSYPSQIGVEDPEPYITWVRVETDAQPNRQLFAGDEQYCGRCSFRPWADTAQLAVDSIPVTATRANGQTRTLTARRDGMRWVTTQPVLPGETVQVAARTIVDEYGERNGAASAGITRDDATRDYDGDGVIDGDDACVRTSGPAANAGCPVPPAPAARDADGDRVPDSADRCATVYAQTADGCPASAPQLADVCEALGVSEASPLCDGLRDGADEFRSQCEDFGGPSELCGLSTGNVHTLIDGCYANAGDVPLPLCRAFDAFAGGVAAGCRTVSTASGVQPPELCALVNGALVSEQALQRYEESWAHRALTLQNRLGYGLPLLHNQLLHTHNSFNAPAENTPQTLSNSDYNQLYAIRDQLRMDIRAIEVDIHWMPGPHGTPETMGFEPKVCHGYTDSGAPHIGCTSEKPLADVLAEIREWLDANPGEVIALYLEDHFGETGQLDPALPYTESARVLQQQLGSRVYLSGLGCDNGDPAAFLQVTRAQIRAAGAQVLIFGESCGETGSPWNSMVHVKKDGNIHQGTQSSYAGLNYDATPSCVLPDEAAFITGTRGQRWSRVWEDSTLVTNVAGGGSPASITPAIARELMRCGLNLPGFDRLLPGDGRLEAAVWSWAPDEPVASATKNCAVQGRESRFLAAACGETHAYACVSDADPSVWEVSGSGPWVGGGASCRQGYRFSVPATGFQNERLAEARRAARQEAVWLNYTDAASDGVWTGDRVAAPGGEPPAPVEPSLCGQFGVPEAVCDWFVQLTSSGNPWLERKPLNISHRGGAVEFPENTLFAYAESRARAGSDMIEADVYETADGELVVMHDASVDRTTDGTGDISGKTLAELKQLDAAYWFVEGSGSSRNSTGAHRWRGVATGAVEPPAGYGANDFRVPTLRELLARFPHTLINLELKPDPDSTGSYEGKMAAILREYGRTDDVIVASFLDTASATFKAQAPRVSTSVPTVQVGASVAAGQGPGPGVALLHDAFQVPVDFEGVPVVDRNFIDDAHANGLAVHVWTINRCGAMFDLLEMGADGIMSDRPSLLERVLDERAAGRTRAQVCPGEEPADGSGSPVPGFGGPCREYFGDVAAPLCAVADAFDSLVASLTGAGDEPGYDQCAGPLCLSQLPLLGDALLRALAPVLAPAPAADGVWLSTDLHVHDDHSADGSGSRQAFGQGSVGNVPVRDQIGYAETVGLDFLALTDHRTFDQHYDPEWTSSRLLMITGEEANGSPHATVFGAVDMINQGATPQNQSDARRLQQSIWDAQLQGAVWTHAHPADGQQNGDGTLNDYAEATGEHLAEAWKRSTLPIDHLKYCENRWNAGWRFGVSGGSDNHFKEVWPVAGPGTPLVRVFAKDRSTAAVLDGLRAGRTTLSLNDRAPFAVLDGDFDGDGVFEAIAGDEVKVRDGVVPKLRVSITNGLGNTVTVYRAPGLAAAPWQTYTLQQPDDVRSFDLTDAKALDWFRVEVRGPGEPSSVAYESVTDSQDPTGLVEADPSAQLHAMTSPLFTYTASPARPASRKLPDEDGDAVRPNDASVPLFGEVADNAFAGFASIAESGGVIHAVATVRAGGESRVLYRRGAGRLFAAPMDLAQSALAREPRIVAAGNDVWVVWQDGRAGETPHRSQIWVRHSGDQGLSWDEPAAVSDAPGRAEHPAIALVTPAQPVVAWQQNGGGAFDIWARVLGRDEVALNLSGAGKTVTPGDGVDSRSAIHPASVSPAVAVKADGTIAVGWQDNRFDMDPGWTGHRNTSGEIAAEQPGRCAAELERAFGEFDPPDHNECVFSEHGTETDDWEILVAQRAAGSAAWGAPVNVSQDTARADRHPTLGFDDAGVLHAAWDSTTNASASGRNLDIRTAQFGEGWTASTVVDPAPAFSAQRPVLGRNGAQLHLFWMDGRGGDWRWRVRRAEWSGTQFVRADDVTEGGNAGWPSYSNGWLVFTGDRNALREQRKPQQVQLLALDAPRAAAPPAGVTGVVTADPAGGTPDVCDPVTGTLCLSQIPVVGGALAEALAPLLGGDDPTGALAAAADPALAQCREGGLPESLCARAEDVAAGAGLARYVDPRIGSVAPGFTNPGPQLPFGMVALGPDTEGPLNYGGYYIHNALLSGFSHVHMSAGVYKGGYFPLLPFTGELTPDMTLPAVVPSEFTDPLPTGAPSGPSDHPMPAYSSGFEHATETAAAGYYAVTVARYGVLAELTASERVGLHRYTFTDPAQPARVLLDASRTLGGYAMAEVRLRDAKTLTGRVDVGFPVFFALQASEDFTVADFAGAALAAGASTGEGTATGVVLDFPGAPTTVLMKLALSYTDEGGAVANLAELPGWDFDATRATAEAKWNALLGKVEVQGGTVAERVSFYSAIYRAMQFPNLHSDVNGDYRFGSRVHRGAARPHYSQFSSWDSYRGQNQLQAEIVPDLYKDMVASLLDFHADVGYLPRWQEGSGDASHMSGDPIIPFIGEAWCRGTLDAPMRAQLWPAMQNLVGRRESSVLSLGYAPTDRPEPYFDATPLSPLNDLQMATVQVQGGANSAGRTLEYGIADFALALMAPSSSGASAALGRAYNYRNLLNPGTAPAERFIHPRHADGAWLTPFQPEFGYGFQEGTSWQYSWLVMHDYAGLIAQMGGDAAVQQRLDTFFNLPAVLATPLAWPTAQNQATVFGVFYAGNQYAPGNEHDLEAPYVYMYAGAPWKTQAVSRAATSIYTPLPNGLPGNDDLGALSGWLVWAMSGLYPVNPGAPLAVAGSPQFTRVVFHRPTGDLVIEAPGASAAAKYVQGLSVNGVAQAQSWLGLPRARTVVRFEMGPVPAQEWGAAATARPPSASTGTLEPFNCRA